MLSRLSIALLVIRMLRGIESGGALIFLCWKLLFYDFAWAVLCVVVGVRSHERGVGVVLLCAGFYMILSDCSVDVLPSLFQYVVLPCASLASIHVLR